MTPDTLLRLANLTAPRKPDRGPTSHPAPFASPATAAAALALPRLDASELPALRELHATIVQLVDRLLGGGELAGPAARLTELARPSIATVRLDAADDQTLRAGLEWSEPTATATLARRVALELTEVDLTRLKRCGRPACRLAFYDTTRSRTQRWHAESPCGNRERQRRYRAVAGDTPTPRLTSARLSLEPLRVEHAPEMVTLLADPRLHEFTGSQPLGLDELRARYERQVPGYSPDGTDRWHNWIVRERASSAVVGYVQGTVDGGPGAGAEVAWTTGIEYQGRGYAREAAAAMLDWLRAQGVSRFVAHIDPGHEASIRVARALGLAATDEVVDGEVVWVLGRRAV